MTWKTTKRLLTLFLAATFVVPFGCAGGPKTLERKDLVHPEAARDYRVTLKDGRTMTLISLHLEGDWLMGTQRITESVSEGEGETARTNITNRYEEVKIPWSDVASVEADRGSNHDSSIFLAGAALVAGVAAFLLLSGNSSTAPSGGGGGGGKGF
jgi:hypothetical protein